MQPVPQCVHGMRVCTVCVCVDMFIYTCACALALQYVCGGGAECDSEDLCESVWVSGNTRKSFYSLSENVDQEGVARARM